MTRQTKDKLIEVAAGFIAALILGFMVGSTFAHSQELPAHPQPSFQKRAATYTVSNDHYLLAMDGALRSMDAKSTHDLLSNPCKCFKEDDPIAPHTGNWAAQSLFQSSALAAVTYGHYLLAKHGHTRLAKILVIADIASESYAVGHNMSLATPKPLPSVPVIAPVTPAKGAFQ